MNVALWVASPLARTNPDPAKSRQKDSATSRARVLRSSSGGCASLAIPSHHHSAAFLSRFTLLPMVKRAYAALCSALRNRVDASPECLEAFVAFVAFIVFALSMIGLAFAAFRSYCRELYMINLMSHHICR